jgi:arylsulfatase A-like enzyme
MKPLGSTWVAWLVFQALAPSEAAGREAKTPAPRPNVVFILADDLGGRDTALYGSTFYETPNLDRLARRGMAFTNAYAASPLCSPTRSSLMTGLWPARTGITRPSGHIEEVFLEKDVQTHAPANWKIIDARSVTRLKLEYVTLAETLRDAGYTTGHFGKWHLGREPYDPLHQGFDSDVPHWFGPSPPAYLAPWKFSGWNASPWRIPYDDGRPGENIEDRMGDAAVAFLRAHKDGPFFLNYWCYSVHSPWQSDPALIEKYRAKADPRNPQHHPVMGAMVEVMDRNIGKLIDAVDALGLADNTLFVFFSDNGGVHWPDERIKGYGNTPVTSNAPLRGGKETLYEGGTRVPCVVVWPGVTRPGSWSDAIVSSVDFYPTLVAATGARTRPGQTGDGVDLRRALEGDKLDRGAIFCHFPHYGWAPDEFPGTWVRQGDWKLIRCSAGNPDRTDRLELYNLNEDIGETNDLAGALPDKAKALNALVSEFLRETKAVTPIPNPAYDPEAERAARAKVQKKRDDQARARAEGKW